MEQKINPRVRYFIYAAFIVVGLVFFFFNRIPLFRMVGLFLAIVCTLALIMEPVLKFWDRKREEKGLVDNDPLDRL